jgi:hypothetical protein
MLRIYRLEKLKAGKQNKKFQFFFLYINDFIVLGVFLLAH